ncbi:hypothetical protein BJV82DRAFT_576552 [Fennellomyces sp. T-0311]|nr:hypothetical protein BJV82DRAFT_576552 [Fennellomyces sp. T-0311]
MTAAASLIKPYLKKLVLQTHPDFFHHDPSKSKLNSASLQQLYTLLNPLLRNEPRPKKGPTLQLEFYGKNMRHKRILAQFEHGSEWQTASALLDLCAQLDIQVAPSDREAVKTMTTKSPSRRSDLTKEFARAFHRQAQEKPIEWSPDLILRNKLLTFGPSVDRQEIAIRWCDFMAELEPERWWGILPALVVTRKDATSLASSERGRGILVFTSDMGCSEIKNYLKANLDIKRRERISMNFSSREGHRA